MNDNQKRKIKMWYKVQELTEECLNKSQISMETGLDRATVRKYQQISEDEFHRWIKQKKNLPSKLKKYHNYVKSILQKSPYLSAAQVEDRLKEHYHEDLPHVHSKTIYNFVQSIRKEYGIEKPSKKDDRVFEKLPEPAYGEESQVDFGETWMQTKQGGRKKVYFFSIVLSRSRYKYVEFTDSSFTSQKATLCLYNAFEYFAGTSKKVIFDLDKVFIYDENLGDYLLTKEFSSFCNSQGFKAVFCRKADPQSKGKVENVIKYVKQNFLRGREYINVDILNHQALQWLQRTANAKQHSTTKLIPKQEFQQERIHLLPLKPMQPKKDYRSYKVRKDNTICYKSNYYTLPLGTYKDTDSTVLLEIKQEQLYIYDTSKQLLCSHPLCFDIGRTIRNTDHKRPKSKSLEKYHNQVWQLFGKSELASDYLQQLRKEKSRYYRDILLYILKNHGNYQNEIIRESLLFCLENRVFNAKDLLAVLNKKQKEKDDLTQVIPRKTLAKIQDTKAGIKSAYVSNVEKSDINKYENILK